MTAPITAELFTSVDLVVSQPQDWHFPWVDDEMLAEISREQATSTLLLGHTTYRAFAAVWPEAGAVPPPAAQLNAMRKVVVSDHIDEADAGWQHTRILRPRGDLAGAVRRLADETSDRITIAGSISIVEQLLGLGLLAELRLIVHPLVLGDGRRLFDGRRPPRIELRHTRTRRFASGARLDVYRPGRIHDNPADVAEPTK